MAAHKSGREYYNTNVQINQGVIHVQERIKYLDSVKGFAILLMILGHMEFHDLNWFIYSFHMPLFFILSGFFFNPRISVTRRIKKLMEVYIITSLVMLSIRIIFQCLKMISFNEVFSSLEIIRDIAAYVCGCGQPVGIGNYLIPEVGPIWFLMALTIGSWMLWVLTAIELRYNFGNLTVISCCILAIIGWCISLYRGQIPFSINQALIIPLFLWIGGEMRSIIINNRVTPISVLLSIIFWGLLLYIQKYVQFISMIQMNSIYYPIYIIGSISASYLIIVIFRATYSKSNLHVLDKLGSATLLILCVHTIDISSIEQRLLTYLLNVNSNCSKTNIIVYSYKIILYLGLLSYILIKNSRILHKGILTDSRY